MNTLDCSFHSRDSTSKTFGMSTKKICILEVAIVNRCGSAVVTTHDVAASRLAAKFKPSKHCSCSFVEVRDI